MTGMVAPQAAPCWLYWRRDAHGRVESMADVDRNTGGEVRERTKVETKEPTLYKVILHNDDYTTMEFVVQVLEGIFHKSPAEAFRIMMLVHTEGQGLCGLYPFEIAETKVATVHDLARQEGFPLRASIEEE
jgi:ATP-dependent Clp protease adaptor protein ClpS